MKYGYYCRVDQDSYVINFLESKKIKYKICTFTNTVIFDIYSDTEQYEELLTYINKLPYHLITKYSVFSKEEMENANWYMIYATHLGIDTSNPDYTYEAKCLYDTTDYGMKRHYHLDQVNPFVSKRTPKWKNRYQFCSVETGDTTRIFCSDYAKDAIISAGITGIDFMPVVKGDLVTKTPNVSQLVFTNKLPLEAYTFIGEYIKWVCPFCGRSKYRFSEPNCDNIRLNIDVIPQGIDAFGSQVIIGEGFGEEILVISKKFYNLITKDLNEKHIECIPIG